MTRPLRNLISAVTLAALTGLLVLAATQWTDVFFRFYPSFSRWILGVLAGITSVTSFPLWEPGLCLIVLWGIISLIRSLVHHHFLRWLSGLLLTLCFAAFFFMTVWGLNYFAPPMSERLGMETQERTAAELREVTAYFLQKANETAPLVERDADGVIEAAGLSQLGKQAGAGYETLAKTMDCFDGSTARVKTLLSSKWFGKTGTTGIFIAFTGESSISSTTVHGLRAVHDVPRDRPPHGLRPRERGKFCRLPRLRGERGRPLYLFRLLHGLPLLLQCTAQGRCRCGKRGLERRVR